MRAATGLLLAWFLLLAACTKPDARDAGPSPAPGDYPPASNLEMAGLPTKTAKPADPAAAEIARMGGVVEFEFTLQPDGSVSDPVIVRELPSGYGFGQAALHAFTHFRFPPRLIDGKPVARRLSYRFTFVFHGG